MLLFFHAFISKQTISLHLSPEQWICELYEDEPLIQDLICDGFPQCGDNSDESVEEGQGCNLFPDSGCDSVRGRKHFRCDRTGDCFATETEARECNNSKEPPPRDCQLEDGARGFKCKNSLCISREFVCDGTKQCTDETDESLEPYGGCNMFPDKSDGCLSIGGERHLQCTADHDKTGNLRRAPTPFPKEMRAMAKKV